MGWRKCSGVRRSYLVKYDRWGFSLNWGWRRDQLADLERMLYLLDGKTIPDNRHDVSILYPVYGFCAR
ncbi:DUF4942 domain-containing protein [Salmonella enterica subsp. enterica serovar Derby]|nr:DUF4942 domain-containing protein [Salmonella enterica subsp. enterica serovar Derby]